MGNDIKFDVDEDEGFLTVPSFTQEQTKQTAPSIITPVTAKTPEQAELLREASIMRNGYYISGAFNIATLNRLYNGNRIRIISSGLGLRGGMVSYLDHYIGIRGYFGLDFASDGLALAVFGDDNFKGKPPRYHGTLVMASAGLDILVDFFLGRKYKHTLGFFIGVGAGALIYFDLRTPLVLSNGTKSNFAWGGNVTVQGGFTMTVLYRHKIEMGLKLLPTQSLSMDNSGVTMDFNPYAAYSYKF